MKVAAVDRPSGLLRLLPVPLEDDVRAAADLADRLVVHWHRLAVIIQHLDIDADRFAASARPAGVVLAVQVVKVGLGDGDDRGGLSETVDLDELPADLLLQAFNEGGRWGSARDDESRLRLNVVLCPVRVVEDDAQHGRRHAGERHLLFLDQAVDFAANHGAQDDVRGAHGSDSEWPAPAVSVEHRQRPDLDVFVPDAEVGDEVVGVDVAVAVRQHHALRPRRGAGGVVDRSRVVLVLRNLGRGGGGLTLDQRVPIGPARGRRGVRRRVRRDPVDDGLQVRADLIDHLRVFVVHQDRGHARVVDDVFVVAGHQAVVERHKDGANLSDAVVAFEEIVRVRAEDADAVALLHAEAREGVRELVHACLELAVGDAQIAIDDRRLIRVELGRAAQEVVDEQWYFHEESPPKAHRKCAVILAGRASGEWWWED